MAARAPESEPYIGKTLADGTFTIDDEVLSSYYAGLDLEPGPALPTTLVSKPDNDYILEAGYSNRFGHLWVRQEWQFLRPFERGVRYQVSGQIKDIYARRDRNVVQYETRLDDERGEAVARSQHHQSFLKHAGALQEVSLRDPKAKPGARRFEVPKGEPFGGLEREITVEMCGEFFHGKANYHTDLEASKALGFKKIVVGGRMTMAYAAHILEQRFTNAWSASGQIDVKFTNPVWVGDVVTAHGVITGPAEHAPERTGAFVWLTNREGTVVLVGSASVVEA